MSDAHREELLRLLDCHIPGVTVWAYGSRVNGKARMNSDLDLVVFAEANSEAAIGSLREAFEESNLPFVVDLHVWSQLPESFQRNIEANHEVIR